MLHRFGLHLRAQWMGATALFLVLAGGTAYATHPGGANTISTGDIINDQVFTQDLANNNMTSLDVRDDTLPSGGLQAVDLRDDSVGTSEVGPDALTAADLANNVIGSEEVVDNSLTGADVDESSLGQVPSAANAERASTASTSSEGSVLTDVTGEVSQEILRLPGAGPDDAATFRLTCLEGDGGGVDVAFLNQTSDPARYWLDDGGSNPTTGEPGVVSGGIQADPNSQIWRISWQGGSFTALIFTSTELEGIARRCHWSAQVFEDQ